MGFAIMRQDALIKEAPRAPRTNLSSDPSAVVQAAQQPSSAPTKQKLPHKDPAATTKRNVFGTVRKSVRQALDRTGFNTKPALATDITLNPASGPPVGWGWDISVKTTVQVTSEPAPFDAQSKRLSQLGIDNFEEDQHAGLGYGTTTTISAPSMPEPISGFTQLRQSLHVPRTLTRSHEMANLTMHPNAQIHPSQEAEQSRDTFNGSDIYGSDVDTPRPATIRHMQRLSADDNGDELLQGDWSDASGSDNSVTGSPQSPSIIFNTGMPTFTAGKGSRRLRRASSLGSLPVIRVHEVQDDVVTPALWNDIYAEGVAKPQPLIINKTRKRLGAPLPLSRCSSIEGTRDEEKSSDSILGKFYAPIPPSNLFNLDSKAEESKSRPSSVVSLSQFPEPPSGQLHSPI